MVQPPEKFVQHRSLGIVLLLLSASAWSTSLITALMAYREGISVNTSNATRFTFAAVFVLGYLLIRRQPLRLPRNGIGLSILLGFLLFIISFGYLTSTRYIPVSLAVLLFYTAPFLVALLVRFIDCEPLSAKKILALIAAFVGLVLALKVNAGFTLNMAGLGFALLAACGLATMIMVSSRVPQRFDPVVLNFYGLTIGALLFITTLLIAGDLTIPHTYSAWLKLGIVGISVAVAQVSLFIGIRHIGSMHAAILMNMEPVFTIALAMLLLGEQFDRQQLAGAILVIAAVFVVTHTKTAG